MTSPLEPPFGIIGLGLIGGSIARALRSVFPTGELYGIEPRATVRDAALRQGVVTRAAAVVPEAESLERCALVFVCAPLDATEAIFRQLGARLRDTTVTDVAGVKEPVEKWARSHLGALRFVGSHPMAGGEQGGFERARADLFRGAEVALCPPVGEPQEAALGLADLWRRLGARPLILSAAEHDRIVAHTSHLPYLAALAQVQIMGDHDERWRLIGRGFLDATRHAGFAPEIMGAVVASNSHLPQTARALADALLQWADLAEHDGKALLERAEALRAIRGKRI